MRCWEFGLASINLASYNIQITINNAQKTLYNFNFYLQQEIPLRIMKLKTQRTSIIDDERSAMKSSEKRIKGLKKTYETRPETANISSCSIGVSNLRTAQNETGLGRPEDVELLELPYFTEKYLMRDDKEENLKDQMRILLTRKRNEIQSLRIYRDELKFISRNSEYSEPVKLPIQVLKQKAEAEQKLLQCKTAIGKEIRVADKELELLAQYQKFLHNFMEGSGNHANNYLDITKEQEIMLRNLEVEKDMLVRELAEEQRRNAREIKLIQDQILEYRIMIKDKQDNLRNLKSKICTLYIKLHSRNSSRTGSKSKDRNMSLSIRKFNNQNHSSIKEAYVGNNTFKSYAKEILEKVTAEEELVKIKFYVGTTGAVEGGKAREQMFFQCFYRGRDGQVHDERNQEPANDDEATRDKISSQSTDKFQQVYVKHLFSMKFFYKSKIVGVECRIKTDKGNKHIHIGNCDPHIEHELLTLVNKKIVTLGSYWHGKEMIGISVWYSDRLRAPVADGNKRSMDGDKKQQAYQEYYS